MIFFLYRFFYHLSWRPFDIRNNVFFILILFYIVPTRCVTSSSKDLLGILFFLSEKVIVSCTMERQKKEKAACTEAELRISIRRLETVGRILIFHNGRLLTVLEVIQLSSLCLLPQLFTFDHSLFYVPFQVTKAISHRSPGRMTKKRGEWFV